MKGLGVMTRVRTKHLLVWNAVGLARFLLRCGRTNTENYVGWRKTSTFQLFNMFVFSVIKKIAEFTVV